MVMMISKITKMFDELIEIYQKFSYEILFNIFKSFQILGAVWSGLQ